jgi:putative pyruvate formate lyase activating enzyme
MATEKKTNPQFVINRSEFEPAYLRLFRSGELQGRVEDALRKLESCQVCPRLCNANRLENDIKKTICKIGRYAMVSSYFAHFGEEDCLRGWKGSGTIFFSMCNLRCVFCQNHDISHYRHGTEVSPDKLATMMIRLQDQGCHNINFVTPEHVVPQILEALPMAVEMGLHLPIVYNTSAYDSLDSLHLLDGVVDIYMPDFKFWSPALAKRYLKAENYPDAAKAVIKEMHHQVGYLRFDEDGLTVRGLLVRHLVMPGCLEDTQHILDFLANEISPHTYINIMDQYRPGGLVDKGRYGDLNRSIKFEEYEHAIQLARSAGIERFDQRKFMLDIV